MQWMDYLQILQRVGLRYLFISGGLFVLFYVLYHRHLSRHKIQKSFPSRNDYVREISYSVLTITIITTILFIFLKIPAITKHTLYYTDIHQHSLWYYCLAFPLMLFMHDTYFYWTHRLMHHPKLFKTFHLVHHQSTNPSPWTAYAFHPLEAMVQASIVPIMLFTIPIHHSHIIIFFFFMIFFNIYGHTGYEFYPKGFLQHWLGKWITTPTSHNQHHQDMRKNFGLYLQCWDRWMHTLNKKYETYFLEIKNRR